MADPVGIVGTAVGVVSLGLQLYEGLKQYLHDFNSRDDRITKALAYLEQLKAALNAIDTAAQSLQTQHQAPADAVLLSLRACLAEMQSLQQKLQEVGPSQQICAKGRIKELKKKFEYPFHISSLEDIGKSLKLITDQLLLATQGLGLHSHLVISTNVDALGDAIKSQAGVLARLSADANRSQKTNSSNTTQLASINLNVQPLKPMLQALESVTKDRFSKFENQIHTNHSATTSRLDILESRTEANAQTMAEVVELLRRFNSRSLPTDQESTGRRLVGAFVSKPSLLRDMHGSFGFQQDGEKSPSNPTTNIAPRLSTAPTRMTLENPRLCSCTSRRIVERRTSRWYSFDRFSEIETESKHGLGCFNYVDVRSQRRKTFGITYFGLRQLVSAAVSVSLCLNYGAGGTSISPVFRYYSVVDKTQSLPFRLIRVLLYAQRFPLFPDSIKPCTQLWAQNIAADCISWIRMVYDNKIASPWDVSVNDQTLIDYFVKLCHTSFFHWPQRLNLSIILSELFHLGVTSTQPLYLIQRPGYAPGYGIGYSNINHTVSLLLRSAPEHQWSAGSINLLWFGDIINQSSEISTAVELDPLCAILLRQDLDSLSQILTTKPILFVSPSQSRWDKSLAQLAVRWPAGLKHILEVVPGFFSRLEFQHLFKLATFRTELRCKYDRFAISVACEDCNCSGPVEILLEYGYPLTSESITNLFNPRNTVSVAVRYAVLRHLRKWRQKLQELSSSISPQDQPTVHQPNLLDYEAPYIVNKLQAIGLDPYETFGLQRDDYRLGSSLPGIGSIYHIICRARDAQMAFDLGFQDVDRISGGCTPLSMKLEEVAFSAPDTDYCRWLIAHGGDYTRNWTWPIKDSILTPGAVASPNYSILHRIFRSQSGFINLSALDCWVSVSVRSPWFSHFAKSAAFYDRCSCACLASPEGCSPFAIYRNSLIQLNARGSRENVLRDAVNAINDYSGVIEPSSDLAESTIRSLTFHRLKIRHTCCASIGRSNSLPHDYGSDFDELREEDEYRVRQLNELVKGFMDQYNESALSLKDFVDGPWVEQMDRIAVEEKNTVWAVQEKNKLLSIGVVPKDDPVDDDESSQCSSACETDYEDEDEAVALRYWNRQFEIIANGGRSEVESREWLKRQFRRASTKERPAL